MCQKFLPKINKGDSFYHKWDLQFTKKGLKVAKEKKYQKTLAKDLKKENRIDFIDQKLNGDINVTSPTGLKTLYDLSNKNLAKTFWKELKA